jgi:hypothetical protein
MRDNSALHRHSVTLRLFRRSVDWSDHVKTLLIASAAVTRSSLGMLALARRARAIERGVRVYFVKEMAPSATDDRDVREHQAAVR